MRPRLVILAATALAAAWGTGCTSPLSAQSERDLRRSVLDSVRREVADAQLRPEPRTAERGPGVEKLQLKPELIPQLERMAGPSSYDKRLIPMDADLLAQSQGRYPLTLEQSVKSAVQNNLSIQFGRLQPAIAEAQVVAAQGAFDWTLFNNFEWDSNDTPTPASSSFGPFVNQREHTVNSLGLKRNLISGGQFTVQNDLGLTDVSTPGGIPTPNPAKEASLLLRLDQPLLRNFGSDVSLAQVRINRNGERDQIARLKGDLIKTVNDTEGAYWRLVQAERDLLILQRLYERGVQTRDKVVARQNIDASPAQVADARSRVETRLAQVLRAQNILRGASDNLKALINHPEAPIGSEVLLAAADDGVDAPISFALADVLTTAIRSRPEVQQAIISIDNTSIRQQVADNARLPRLDLRLQAQTSRVESHFEDAFSKIAENRFVDYLAGIQLEVPLGNRSAEALHRQRRLERMQATIAYRNTVQQVILEAKRALRNVLTNFALIQQTRVARYAATENLRSFEVEMQLVVGFSVVNLDLEFTRQEILAQAERDEASALTDYQTALAQLYAAMGTALEHSQIEFRVPDADEALASGGLNTPANPVTPRDEKAPYIAPPSPPWRTDKR